MSAPRADNHTASSRPARNSAALATGNKAIYPGQGPCRIGHVVMKMVNGQGVMFYHLIILDESGGDLFVPVEKARAIGLRLMMKKSEIPKVLAHLKKTATAADNWKQRATENSKLFTSGSAFDLAEIVASLTELRDSRPLTLQKARKLLIGEISEVMGETKTIAEGQLDRALQKAA